LHAVKSTSIFVFGALALFLSGCVTDDSSAPLIAVESYSGADAKHRTSYWLTPHPELGLTENDPVFLAYTEPIHSALQSQSFSRGTREDCNVAILVRWGDLGTKEIEHTRDKPIYGATGGGAQSHTYTIPTAQGLKTVTGSTVTYPQFGIVGYKQEKSTSYISGFYLVFEAYAVPTTAENIERLWATMITTAGTDVTWSPSTVGQMSAAGAHWFTKNTDGRQFVKPDGSTDSSRK
jgi:hypothetical protein